MMFKLQIFGPTSTNFTSELQHIRLQCKVFIYIVCFKEMNHQTLGYPQAITQEQLS